MQFKRLFIYFKKNSLLSFLLILVFFIGLTFSYIISDSQSKFTLKVKSLVSKDVRIFLKNSINFYLYNFDIKMSFENERIIDSFKGRSYSIREYNNKLLDYQGPRAYLENYEENIFLVTGTGLISFSASNNFFKNKNLKLKNIPSNIKDIIKYDEFFVDSRYTTKGVLIDNNYFYISIINKIENDCFTLSIIKSKLNLDFLNFSYLFNSNQCVKKNNLYGEFQPIQSGGMIKNFDNEYLLLTTGEFRYRDHAQENDSIFGKLLLINKITGEFKIVSKGHRNSQGIYYDRKNKVIVATEHGPFGGDEINIINDFDNIQNYGWPISSYGEHYPRNSSQEFYDKAPLKKSHSEFGFVEPIKYFVPSIGITQIVKKNDNIENNNYFFSSMGYEDRENSLSIHQIIFDNEYKSIIYEDKIKINNRVRDLLYLKNKKKLFGFLEKKGSIIVLDLNE